MRDGRVLLARRARPPQQGLWDTPGGFVEPGELPEDAVVRELREETGLEVEPVRLIGFFLDRYGDDGVSTLNIHYEARVLGGEESPADDVSELGWFPLDAIPDARDRLSQRPRGDRGAAGFARRRKAVTTFGRLPIHRLSLCVR